MNRSGYLPFLLLSGGVGLVGTFALLTAVMTGFNMGYTTVLHRHHGQMAAFVAALCAGMQLLIIAAFAFLGGQWPLLTRRMRRKVTLSGLSFAVILAAGVLLADHLRLPHSGW